MGPVLFSVFISGADSEAEALSAALQVTPGCMVWLVRVKNGMDIMQRDLDRLGKGSEPS